MQEQTVYKLMSRYRETGLADDLGALFDLVAPSLFQTALHLTNDPQGAEDLLQETFLAVMKSIGRWNPKKKASPWLMGILKREAQMRARRERRKPAPERLANQKQTTPQSALEKSEASRALQTAVAALPDLYREVVDMVLTNGDAPAEIAAKLNLTPGAIRTRLHRGISILKKGVPSGVAIPAALLVFQGTSLAAVRSSVLAQASTVKASTATGLLTIKVLAAVVGVSLVVGAAIQTNKYFADDDAADALVETANNETELSIPFDADKSTQEARRSIPSSSSPDLADRRAAGASKDGGAETPKTAKASSETRTGSFAMHYKQGYSFSNDAIVPKEEADLYFETCAGGISSIVYTSKNGVVSYPKSVWSRRHLHTRQRSGQKDYTANCYFRSALALDLKSIKWSHRISCDDRRPRQDVFVVKTKGGGFALCAILERLSDGGWTKNQALVEYVWNPKEAIFDETRSANRSEGGFMIDMSAFEVDHAQVAADLKKSLEKERLESEIRARALRHGRSGDGRRVGVVLSSRFASKITKDRHLASLYSSFDFTLARNEAVPKRGRDRDFSYSPWKGSQIRLCTVTGDRSKGWNLGNVGIGSWSLGVLRQKAPAEYLKCSAGSLLLIHSLDSRINRWTEMKVLDVDDKAVVFNWQIIEDKTRIMEIEELLHDPSKDMRYPMGVAPLRRRCCRSSRESQFSTFVVS
ncbi:MAG: sigma-70 family RNA polymerase sigma factor [Planctomycetota bacterium]